MHARVMRGLRFGAVACVLLSLVLSVQAYISYRSEQAWIAVKARQIVAESGAKTREEQIRALQRFVKTNIRRENAPVEGRPFLRSSARESIESGQGWCGEATRAFIALARPLGISAQRMNLHGTINHVVPEVELRRGRWVLVDIQDSTVTNAILDPKLKEVDEVIGVPGSPFVDYSNINLRRAPGLNLVVQRIKLHNTILGWLLESPQLMRAVFFGGLAALIVGIVIADRLLIRLYSHRLGIAFKPRRLRS
jgi:hypothetical protein